MPSPPTSVFVYGTLKRGQLRETKWPREPRAIEDALVRGQLYDLGPYPALAPPALGSAGDRIAGEVWSFHRADVAEVLRVLDQIEGYDQPGEANLYERSEVRYELSDGRSGKAFTYFYAAGHDRLTARHRIAPAADGLCRWPRPGRIKGGT
jgi:gamma-glutamylcyclotransferase (GGCT)/AIG2-like uncharacterized protein YtfP